MLRAVIIEPEQGAARALMKVLDARFPSVKTVGGVTSVQEGIREVIRTSPELIFLGMDYPEQSRAFLETFSKPFFDIIYLVREDRDVARALEWSGARWLRKPVDPDQLQVLLDAPPVPEEHNAQIVEALHRNLTVPGLLSVLALPAEGEPRFVTTDSVLFLKAEDHYTHFFLTSGERFIVHRDIDGWETLLTNSGFFRSHRFFLVNLSQVKHFVKKDGSYLLMNNDEAVYLHHDRIDAFQDAFHAWKYDTD